MQRRGGGGSPSDSPGIHNVHADLSNDGRFATFTADWSVLSGGSQSYRQDIVLYDRDVDGNGVFDEPGSTNLALVSASSADGVNTAAPGFRISVMPAKPSRIAPHNPAETRSPSANQADANAGASSIAWSNKSAAPGASRTHAISSCFRANRERWQKASTTRPEP